MKILYFTEDRTVGCIDITIAVECWFLRHHSKNHLHLKLAMCWNAVKECNPEFYSTNCIQFVIFTNFLAPYKVQYHCHFLKDNIVAESCVT